MDWFNRFTDRLFKREAPSTEFEAYYKRLDLDHFFGQLNNMWEPNELIWRIGGHKNLKKVMIDPEIYAAFETRKAAILDTKLILESDSEEVKKFFEDQLLPFEDQLKQDFWQAIPFGYSVEQIIYDPDRSCKVIGFQREQFWRYQPMQDLMHVKVIDSSNYEYVNQLMPYGKFVLTSHGGSYYNPYGDAIVEKLIQPWMFRCTDWDLWLDFAKRFANGFMHAKIEDGTKIDEVKAELAKAAKGAILVTDKNSDLSLIQASRDSSLYATIDDRVIASIQKVILGQTMTSEMQDRGSSGAAGVQNEVRLEKFRADVKMLEKSFNETIKQIAYVCGIEENIPTAKLITDIGLNNEQAARDATLNGMGVKFTKQYYIDNYGFKDQDFDIVEPQVNPFGSFAQKKSLYLKPEDIKKYLGVEHTCISCNTKPNTRKATLAPNVTRKQNRQLEEREDAVSFLQRNGAEPLNMYDIIAAIQSSKNEKELDQKLLALFDQDNSSEVDLLTNTLYHVAAKGALFGNPKVIKNEEE